MRIGITGGSGSLGSALIRDILNRERGTVVTLTRDEYKAQLMAERYGGAGGNVRIMLVADGLANQHRLAEVFRGCDVLIHAAALKRISESVYSSAEMLAVNAIGTQNLLAAATEIGVKKVLIISSDKACAPINCYGATKYVAECLAIQHNAYSIPRGTAVAIARYGNVLGSRGSVVHLWRKQIEKKERLTVTHGEMTRFLITLERACDFIWDALNTMIGGEIYIPALSSAWMRDVAVAVAENAGVEPRLSNDMGLRPGGEKLHEMLINGEESLRTYRHNRGHPYDDRYTIVPSHRTWSDAPYDVGHPIVDEGGPQIIYSSDAAFGEHGKLSLDQLKWLLEHHVAQSWI
tara:strand:+ start:1759 stop:2802 length:1044 start_codon:yes stop_codon:yes gene_type:complete